MSSNSTQQQQLVLRTTFLHSDGTSATWEDDNRTILDNTDETKQKFAQRLAQDLGRPGAFNTVESLGDGYTVYKGVRNDDAGRHDIRIYGTNMKPGYYDCRFGSKGYYHHWLWLQCGGECFCHLCCGKRLPKEKDYAPLIKEMLKRFPPIRMVALGAQPQALQAQAGLVAPAVQAAAAPSPKGKARRVEGRIDSTADIFAQDDDATDTLNAPATQPEDEGLAASEASSPPSQPPIAQNHQRDENENMFDFHTGLKDANEFARRKASFDAYAAELPPFESFYDRSSEEERWLEEHSNERIPMRVDNQPQSEVVQDAGDSAMQDVSESVAEDKEEDKQFFEDGFLGGDDDDDYVDWDEQDELNGWAGDDM